MKPTVALIWALNEVKKHSAMERPDKRGTLTLEADPSTLFKLLVSLLNNYDSKNPIKVIDSKGPINRLNLDLPIALLRKVCDMVEIEIEPWVEQKEEAEEQQEEQPAA